jgi:16S rRNA (adenine1518-N6/adenine1519-N6)-dimethyltransferase
MELPFAKKSLGQHWLSDSASLEAICEAAKVMADDTVLEIGPGLGTLTELLVERAKQVVAVEFDAKLADELPSRVRADNLEVMSDDILGFDFTQLPPGYKVVANIPYYLTSNLIRVLSESANPPSVAALLVQKEVAQRVAAGPGQMSILILNRRPEPLFTGVDSKRFFRIVKAGFAQKRKTLANSLSGGMQIPRGRAVQLLDAAGIDPAARAQTLSLDDWHQLYQVSASPSLHT